MALADYLSFILDSMAMGVSWRDELRSFKSGGSREQDVTRRVLEDLCPVSNSSDNKLVSKERATS